MRGTDRDARRMDDGSARVYDAVVDVERPMLDAYIIDRIRREREQQRKDTGIPLRIEREPPRPAPPAPPDRSPPNNDDDHDVGVVIDYRL